MNEALISVIVPVYKVEAYLERCVDSIRNQTYKNLEIILVDDGSPDRSGQMCDELALSDSRIRVIHKVNGGLSDARNAGLDAMTGDYVSFVDSDDWIQPDMMEVLLGRMIKENAKISCCGMVRCTDEQELYCFNPNREEQFTLSGQEAQMELLRNYRITNSMNDKLFSAEIFKELRMKKGVLFEDMQLQYRCIAKADRVTYIGTPFYCYYMAANSISRCVYTLKHYDEIRNSEERIAFYEEQYPACVPLAKAMHLDICMAMVLKTADSPDWKDLRKDLTKLVCAPVSSQVAEVMPKRVKVKRMIFKISPDLLILASRLMEWVKRVRN